MSIQLQHCKPVCFLLTPKASRTLNAIPCTVCCHRFGIHTGERLGLGPTMNLILLPTPTVSPTAIAPPLGSNPMIPLIRKSFASSSDSSLKSSGATAKVRLLLTSSLHIHTHRQSLVAHILSQVHTHSHIGNPSYCLQNNKVYKSSLCVNFISSCGPATHLGYRPKYYPKP